MAHFLLIRHGETDWNREGRFQGSRDIPLNEVGLSQAREVAAFLRDKHLDAIWSSHLQRARVTAELIAEPHGLEVQINKQLQEVNLGAWEGLTPNEVRAAYPEIAAARRENAYNSPPPPGGEAYPDFQKRCIDALDEIAALYDASSKVAVVSHGGAIKAVLGGLLGMPWRSRGLIYLANCSITRLNWQSGGKVFIDGFNEAGHLSQVFRPNFY